LRETIKKEYIAGIDRENIFQPEHRVKLEDTDVYAMEFDYHGGKRLAVYNPGLRRKSTGMRWKRRITSPRTLGYTGYSAIHHSTSLSAKKVVKTYVERDIVEPPEGLHQPPVPCASTGWIG
jgi:hypothetical protein